MRSAVVGLGGCARVAGLQVCARAGRGHGGLGGAVGGGRVEGVTAGQEAVVEGGGDGADHLAGVGAVGEFAAVDGLLDARGPFVDANVVEAVQGGGRIGIAGGGGDDRFEQRPLARVC